jgi:hypothetical protein
MRYIIIAAVGLTCGYLGLGMVATFGSMIMVALGFLTQDVQDQTKQLTAVLKGHSECRVMKVRRALRTFNGCFAA